MSDDLKNILSNLNKDIEQDKLLQYINRNLPDAEQHELEKQMNDDDFMNDAIEGLEQLKDKQEIPAYILQLNAGLAKQIKKNKKRNDKRKDRSLFIETKVYIFFRHSSTQIRLQLSKLIPGWFINNL